MNTDIKNQLDRILKSNLSQQISSSLIANQQQIKNLQQTLSSKNNQVHLLNKKLKQQLQFINTVIKKNTTLERRIAELIMYVGKLIREIQQQKLLEKKIIFEEVNKMKYYSIQKVEYCFEQMINKMNSIMKQKEIQYKKQYQQLLQKTLKIKQYHEQDVQTYSIHTINENIQTDVIQVLIQKSFYEKEIQTCNFQKNFASQIDIVSKEHHKNNQKILQYQKIIEQLKQYNSKLYEQIRLSRNIQSQQRNQSYILSPKNIIKKEMELMYQNQFIFEEQKYKGQTIRGVKNGRGICYYDNGFIYDGFFENGQRSGLGILKFNDIQIYRGYWLNNKFQGKGILKSLFNFQNSEFSGLFKDGKQDGLGTLKLQNGAKIKGKWKDQSIIGSGMITLNSGQSFLGKFTQKHQFQTQDGKLFVLSSLILY